MFQWPHSCPHPALLIRVLQRVARAKSTPGESGQYATHSDQIRIVPLNWMGQSPFFILKWGHLGRWLFSID